MRVPRLRRLWPFLALAETVAQWISRARSHAGENILRLRRSHVARADSRGAIMDGQTLHACAKRCAGTVFTEHCWPFGPQYDNGFKVGGKNIHAVHWFITVASSEPGRIPKNHTVNQQIY